MRDLDEIRNDIDTIDRQIRDLIMQRLECSREVVASKINSGNYVIYRADREEAILEKLGAGVPEEKKPGYLSLVRKVTETSRMFQYGILFEKEPGLFQSLMAGHSIPENASAVKLRLVRPNIPNAMSSILSMIGDYGYNMDRMTLIRYHDENSAVEFELDILGDLHAVPMQKLMLQLSMENQEFRILEII